jgi:hypothetical protein
MTMAEILQQAKTLSVRERKELVKLLVDSLDVSEAAPRQQRRLSELRGLGKEVCSVAERSFPLLNWLEMLCQPHAQFLLHRWG